MFLTCCKHALARSAVSEGSSDASLAGTSGCALSCTAVPSSLLAVELGFRDCSSASAGAAMDSGASGVGGARLEGWPPLFPDATVRGEDGNIRYELWHERKARTQLTVRTTMYSL